jgi:hypothetical protein
MFGPYCWTTRDCKRNHIITRLISLIIKESAMLKFRFGRRAAAAAVVAAGAVTLAGLTAGPAQAGSTESASAEAVTFSRLKNVHSTHVLAAQAAFPQSQPQEGSKIVQMKVNSTDHAQQWKQQVNSDGTLTYVLRKPIKSSKGTLVSGCLDLPTDVNRLQQKSGTVLVVRPCDGSNSQQWKKFFSAAAFQLENKLSGMNLDAPSKIEFSAAIQNSVFSTSQDFVRSDFVTV